MKVLFVCTAHETHFQPMVPLAWALRTAGHEVRVAAPPEVTDTITGAGLTAVPIGVAGWMHNDDPTAAGLLGRLFGEGGVDHVQYFDFTGRSTAQWSWEGLLALQQIMTPTLYASMNNGPMIDDLVAFARSWQPDLVVREAFTWAGGVVAEVVGAAHARMLHGPDTITRSRHAFLCRLAAEPAQDRIDPTAEWLGYELQRFGRQFGEVVMDGHFTISQAPGSTRLDLGLHTVGIRYVPFNGRSVVPGWLREPPSRLRICVTNGVAARENGRASFSQGELLESLADLDAEVVVTMTAQELARLDSVPGNVRVVDFVPMHDLLPTCAAVVHHGGGGTRASAEYHGVPQVIVAHGWDTVEMAERITELGAGLMIPVEEVTPAAVLENVRRLLDEPSFSARAADLRRELMTEPTCNEVVPLLEKLTEEYQTHRTRV